MKLEEYVSDILTQNKHPASFPDHLDIPKELVKYCWSLYESGEKAGRERGVNLHLRNGKLVIDSNVVEGTPTGITIDNATASDNFGDLHCHPSASIGHVNGYAAFSAEDWLAIEKNTAKLVFIVFFGYVTLFFD
jgi:hypothetical protein